MWCVREGIRESIYRYWRKRLATQVPASQLIALPMVASPPESVLELCTPNGYVLRPVEPGSGALAGSRAGSAALMWGTPQGMVYLATGHHDVRKSITGLALVVADALELDPAGTHWFVFCNRGGDRIKILHRDTNGFWLHCRRLEQGKFHWPKKGEDAQALAVTAR